MQIFCNHLAQILCFSLQISVSLLHTPPADEGSMHKICPFQNQPFRKKIKRNIKVNVQINCCLKHVQNSKSLRQRSFNLLAKKQPSDYPWFFHLSLVRSHLASTSHTNQRQKKTTNQQKLPYTKSGFPFFSFLTIFPLYGAIISLGRK